MVLRPQHVFSPHNTLFSRLTLIPNDRIGRRSPRSCSGEHRFRCHGLGDPIFPHSSSEGSTTRRYHCGLIASPTPSTPSNVRAKRTQSCPHNCIAYRHFSERAAQLPTVRPTRNTYPVFMPGQHVLLDTPDGYADGSNPTLHCPWRGLYVKSCRGSPVVY